MQLTGNNILIIGGSSGTGLATARLAKELGASVTIAGRSREKLERAAQQLGDVRAVAADITREADVQAMILEFPSIDHIFISAGRMLSGGIVETDLAVFRSEVDQRFWGPLYIVRHAAPKMAGGSITFISGQYASRPSPGDVIIAALNAAIEGLARGLALELAPVRVNAIAPGAIDTPFLGAYREGAEKWARESLPVRRIGRAEDIAQAAILLMTNGYITGEVLHVDGGGRLV